MQEQDCNHIATPLYRTYGLEVRVAEHCNLTCAGCSQSSPHLDAEFADVEQVEAALERLKHILRPSRVTLIGGEPLLHPRIVDILDVVRTSGMFDTVYVTTNGTRLSTMPDAFWRLCDTVEVSVYPSTSRYLARVLEELKPRAKSAGTNIVQMNINSFRHVNLAYRTGSRGVVERIYSACFFKHFCHTLYKGRFYKCAPSASLIRAVWARTGERLPKDEGIPVLASEDLAAELKNYLFDSSPLHACDYCLGSSGAAFPHRLQARAEPPDRLRYSGELVDPALIGNTYPPGFAL